MQVEAFYYAARVVATMQLQLATTRLLYAKCNSRCTCKGYTCTSIHMASTREDTYNSVYTWYVCTSSKSSLHTIFNWELSVELRFASNYIDSLQPSQRKPSCVCNNNQNFATDDVLYIGKLQ